MMEAEVVCKACNSLGKLGNDFPLFFSHYVGSRNLLVKRSWKSHGGSSGFAGDPAAKHPMSNHETTTTNTHLPIVN